MCLSYTSFVVVDFILAGDVGGDWYVEFDSISNV
jgi:hypothetical protein